jgi:hypothetical protein
MTKKIWYAVSGKGQGKIFTTFPVRDEKFKVWLGESIGCITMTVMLFESEGLIEFPPITWDDDAVAYEITIS